MSASAGRVLILLKGEYNSAAQYQMLDAVRYNGSLYIAKKATSGNTPQDGEYWMLCATGAEWGDISGNIANQTDLQNALRAKQDTLTFDSTPTESSGNPVTSAGIKTALDAKMPNPSGGVAGDVLVKKATGVDWDTLSASDVALGTGTVEDLAGSVATIELSPALNTYAIGEFLLWNGVLYKVTAHIDAGENLVVGTNISAVNVGAELTSLNNGLMDVTSYSLSLPSGWSSDFVVCKKVGKTVFISGLLIASTAQTVKMISFPNIIPEEIRCPNRIGFAAFDNNADTPLHSFIQGRTITFYRPETTSLTKIEFSLVYSLI